MIEEDDLPDDDPAVEYWIPFIRRMDKIPREYQMAIIDEYLKVENVMVQRKMDKRAIKNKLVQEQLFRPHPSSCRCEGIRAKKLWNG